MKEVMEALKRCAAAHGTTPEAVISEMLIQLQQEKHHPIHISKSTHKVTLRVEAVRKLALKEDVQLSAMAELTGISVNTLRRMTTYSGRICAKTAWKLANSFHVPIESICNIKSLRGVVTGWEDTEKTMK